MVDLQKLADCLGLTLGDLEESGATKDDIQENRGNSGETYYSYFLVILDDVSFEILKETSIPSEPGELLNISRRGLEVEAE